MDHQAPLLEVNNLKTWFDSRDQIVRAVDGVNFSIKKGETFALLGESGCGKSMTSLSLMRLVPEPAGRIVSGSVKLNGVDLLQLTELKMQKMRGNHIAMIFQEPMTSLNPVLTIGKQIEETVTRHKKMGGYSAKKRVLELLDAVGIPDPKQRYDEYPHQLSGGMKQRVMIAIALAGEPALLVADEPTTALDVTIQLQVLELLRKLQNDTGMAILLITHDLGVVAEMADRVAVMYAGQIVEHADRQSFFSNPQHPYSKKLFDSVPAMAKREHSLAVIRGSVPALSQQFKGCRFEPRCDYAWDICRCQVPAWQLLDDGQGVLCHLLDPRYASQAPDVKKQIAPVIRKQSANHAGALLQVDGLKVHFPVTKGLFKRTVGFVKAVDDVSLVIPKGKTLALVGESGCGKTTVGKGILQLVKPTAGCVVLDGAQLNRLKHREMRAKRRDVQVIFQDPFSSMNPRMMIADIIEEGMLAQRVGGDARQRQQRIDQLLGQVGLAPEAKTRYPHEFSGGQRQRICIARALAVEPKLIICDEPTSALDVSVQAQILNLLKDLQDSLGLAYLFITHNLSVVEYLAHEIAVMYLGRIVEQGTVEEVIHNPLHPYTKALLSAVPTIVPDADRQVIRLRGEMPSATQPPIGCHFNPRCANARQICRNGYPEALKISDNHRVRCFLYKE
ncbi:MAG: ABC transporter ATP-binding protein [Gammaproteobacteria bacterium]|nr:ABC transporter ATP-binding protein [Gammaproteobacteria bacterium]